jgi:type I restriction enzyme S subunit
MSNSAELVGKVAKATEQHEGFAFGAFLSVIRSDAFDSDFLYYLFRSEQIQRALRDTASQTVNIANLSLSGMAKISLPLPPIPDQRRIVVMVDRLFERSRSAREELARIPHLVERYKQATLAAATNGELTADWRKYNKPRKDASALLKMIQGGSRKDPRVAPARNDSTLPDGWVYARIEDAGQVILGRQRAPQHHSGKHMRPYLRVANVFEARIDVSDVMEMNFTPDEYEKFKLLPGDILLNEGQSKELVGRPAMFNGELKGVCFTNTLVRFRPYSPISGEYALLLFRHYLRSGRFQAIANITTNIAHLGAGRFANLPFPLPPVEEQAEIVRLCGARLASLDRICGEVDRALGQIDRLDKATLDKAFSGKLIRHGGKSSR